MVNRGKVYKARLRSYLTGIEMNTIKITENGGKLITKGTINFVDTHGYIPKAMAILKRVKNLRLVGETGTGKSTLAYKLAEMTGKHLYEISLTSDISRWDLLASDTLKAGNTETRKGIVLQWLEDPEGGILFVDEFNFALNGVVSLFNSLSDFRGSVYVPELGISLERTPNHWLIIAFNPTEKSGYSGTCIQNIATMRRFEGIIVDYLDEIEERKLIKAVCTNYEFSAKWVEIAKKTRDYYRKGKLRTPITTGNLINYAGLYKDGLAEEEIIEIAKSLYPEDEWSQFVRFYEEAGKIDFKTLKGALDGGAQ